MKSILILIACTAIALPATPGDSKFKGIGEGAANIQRDAELLNKDLKAKTLDETRLKADIASLGADIASLRKEVESIDASLDSLSAAQKKDWELVKTKVQLLTIFYDRKAELMSGDLKKNRSLLRAHADGIAKRAAMLEKTVKRL